MYTCSGARTRTRTCTHARLDCENYVGKTAIRRRCNNLSRTASRVGGNYAELMRSSSCGPRIIYSESASLSPCITRSAFSAAAHVCLVSAWNPRDTPRREINFPILRKRSRWPEGSRMPENRDGVTVHRTSNRKRGDYYMVLTGACYYDIARNVNKNQWNSKSSRIKKSSKRSTKANTNQMQTEVREE